MKITKIREVKTPTRGTPESAGIDFYVPEDFDPVLLAAGQDICIPSGVKANVPAGHALIAFNKSGVALKAGLQVGACVVDEDYQGEIHLHMMATKMTRIEPGQKLVQFILVPVFYDDVQVVDEEELFEVETERGAGGFGSTGSE